MKRLSSLLAVVFISVASSTAWATINDSTGYSSRAPKYGDTVYSSTWDRVSGKPETATRWPKWSEISDKPAMVTRWPNWNEVTGRPSTFPPSAHHHDSRYLRRDTSGTLSGNLTASGTVAAKRLVTDDVSGERWCRANSAGRIQCTHDAPGNVKNVAKGLPLLMDCGTGLLYFLDSYGTNGKQIAYRTLLNDRSRVIYDASTGAYLGKSRDEPHPDCKKNFHDIPAWRKML